MGGFSRRRALGLLASTSLLAAAPAVAKGKGGPLYKDAAAPIDLRVRDLLARMTLEDKVGQIVALWATKADVMDDLTFSPAKASKAYPDGFGQIRSEEHTSELLTNAQLVCRLLLDKNKKQMHHNNNTA